MDTVKSVRMDDSGKLLADRVKLLKQENPIINKNVDGEDIPLSDEERDSVLAEWAAHDLAVENYENERNVKRDRLQRYYEWALNGNLSLVEVQTFLALICELHGLVPDPKTG